MFDVINRVGREGVVENGVKENEIEKEKIFQDVGDTSLCITFADSPVNR
jgi:hypothetical protein